MTMWGLKESWCRRSFACALVAAAAAMPASRADAAATCTVSTTGVAFGAYNPRSSTATTGVGTVTVTCSGNVGTMTLSSGTGQSGTYSSRVMKSGTSSLNYNLYTTSSYATVWGNGTSGSATRSLSAAGSYTVYGRIPALQNVAAGTYTDNVVVTLTY